MELELDNVLSSVSAKSYYIIPIWNWSSCTSSHHTASLISLHYSYMELEPVSLSVDFSLSSSITLFLYGIGAIISLAELGNLRITLFLYGIGALVLCFLLVAHSQLHYSYMELELQFFIASSMCTI